MRRILRDYEPSDSRRIWEILEDSLASYDLPTDPDNSDADLSDVHASYIVNGGAFRVLADGKSILGMYGLRNEEDAVTELRKMYLDPSQKGKGYGKLMLEDALDVARSLGFHRVTLETNEVLIEAIGLYRSYGFVETSREKFSDRCDYAMVLELIE